MAEAYDVCVVGGGIVGLWVARRLADAGADCVLIERDICGSGASGGILGALMAHAPDNWNIKKQFQFDALAELPGLIDQLESQTGLATGYARCGRIMPVRTEKFRQQAKVRSEASRRHWRSEDARFSFDLSDQHGLPVAINPDLAPLGVVRDSLAARVNPAMYVRALKAAITDRVRVVERCAYVSADVETGRIKTRCSELELTAKRIVLSAGYETFGLAEPILDRSIGSGVKGQAALFACPDLAGQPILYDDGIYIVPHEDGLCAVGSTTEKTWTEPDRPDDERNDYIERAKLLCPPLRRAPLVRRWAGVRPRCLRTDPIIGALDARGRVLAATGGYKITFGIAHRMAQCIVDDITGTPRTIDLPPTFRPEHHLQERL